MEMFQRCNIQTTEKKVQLTKKPMVWKCFKDVIFKYLDDDKDTTNRRPNGVEMFKRCNIQTSAKTQLLTKNPMVWKCFKDAIFEWWLVAEL